MKTFDLILYSAIGAVALALVNAFFKRNPLDLPFFWLLLAGVIPTTFAVQLFFILAYRAAPFHKAWFVGTAFTAITGFLCSLLVFGEHIRSVNLFGIVTVLAGAYMLTR